MKLLNKVLLITVIITLAISCKKEKEDEPQTGNRPPGDFVVSISPEENSALISWTAATDPDGDVVTYSVIVEDDTLVTESVELLLSIDSLEFESAYTGSVIASDSKSLFKVVEFDFETGVFPNDPPGSFSLFSPTNNMTNIPLYPNMNWGDALDPEGGAVTYDVYLGTSNPPLNLVGSELTSPSFTVTIELSPQTVYYWTINAKDALEAETSTEIFSFTTQGTVTANLLTDEPGFSVRGNHTSVVFDDKMWVIAGGPNNNGAYEDVWNSNDGVNWTLATNAAEFGIRKMHASVVFDNKIWLIGGLGFSVTSGNEFNDVWYSENGISWTMATDNAAFEPRFFHQAVVFNGKMWVYGGRNVLNDFDQQQAWSSVDGVTWVQESPGIDIGGFIGCEITEFEGKLFKTGGLTDAVYSTIDGVNWVLEVDDVGFGERFQHQSTVSDGKLWLISGSDQEISLQMIIPDVWYTENGSDWILSSPDAGFTAVRNGTAISHNNGIYLIGGETGAFNATNDVYLIE